MAALLSILMLAASVDPNGVYGILAAVRDGSNEGGLLQEEAFSPENERYLVNLQDEFKQEAMEEEVIEISPYAGPISRVAIPNPISSFTTIDDPINLRLLEAQIQSFDASGVEVPTRLLTAGVTGIGTTCDVFGCFQIQTITFTFLGGVTQSREHRIGTTASQFRLFSSVAATETAILPSVRSSLSSLVQVMGSRNLSSGDFTEATWEAFDTALVSSRGLATNLNASVIQLNQQRASLLDAYNQLESLLELTRSVLQGYIALANQRVAIEYTEDSWQVLSLALAQATALVNTSQSIQALENAVRSLQEALVGLESQLPGAKEALSLFISEVADLNLNPLDYDSTTYTHLVTLLENANQVLVQATSVGQVREAHNQLQSALDGLYSVQGLRAQLRDLHQELSHLNAEDFTEASWSAFIGAWSSAGSIMGVAATSQNLQTAYNDLQEAYSRLVTLLETNRQLLASLLETVNALNLQEVDFTSESWSVFAAAMESAATLLDSTDSTLSQLQEAYGNLNAAVEGLMPLRDVARQELINLIEELVALGLQPEMFTPQSWAIFQEALAEAQYLVELPQATQNQLHIARIQLNNAYHGLIDLETFYRQELETFIETLDGLNLQAANYTTESWEVFAAARTVANEVVASISADHSQIQAAHTALREAFEGLVLFQPPVTIPASGLAVLNANNIPLRAGSDAGYPQIMLLSRNTEVNILATNAAGTWTQIRVGSAIGWVNTTRLTHLNAYAVINANNIPLRQGASSNTPSLMTLSQNSRVTILGQNEAGNWSQIQVGNQTGWVNTTRLSRLNLTGYINANNIPLRAGAGTGFAAIQTLRTNTPVTVLGQSQDGSWINVRVVNQMGWIRDNRITTTQTSGIINANNIPLRSGAGQNFSSLRNLNRNTPVTIVGQNEDGTWLQVRVGNQLGWVRDNRITVVQRNGVINANNIPLRSGDGASFSSLRSLSRNTAVVILGQNAAGSWTRIQVGNTIGWVSTSRITTLNTYGAINANNIPLRQGAGSSTPSLSTLSRNSWVVVLGQNAAGNWTQVQADGQIGWVSTSRITHMSFNGSINANNIPLRSGAGTGFATLQTLGRNTRAAIIGQNEDGSWLHIRVGNQVGWVRNDRMNTIHLSGVINANNIPLRAGAGSSFSATQNLSRNTQVIILGQNLTGNWTQIQVGGQIGWVNTSRISQ